MFYHQIDKKKQCNSNFNERIYSEILTHFVVICKISFIDILSLKHSNHRYCITTDGDGIILVNISVFCTQEKIYRIKYAN